MIRGKYHYANIGDFTPHHIPLFCHYCGNPYPWTEKALNDIKEIISEHTELEPDEKEKFTQVVEAIIIKDDESELGASKFKKFADKAGAEGRSFLRDVMVNVVSGEILSQLFRR